MIVQIDVDIGSSTVANGVLGLVFGVITSLVVDMAFLIQVKTLNLIVWSFLNRLFQRLQLGVSAGYW